MAKHEKKKTEEGPELSEVIGGKLDIFGLNIDLGKLISSPEEVRGQVEGLREKLKQLGGKETLTDEEWKAGGATVSGFVKTRGILGENEYHIGTTAGERPRPKPEKVPKKSAAPEIMEPPLDVFEEAHRITLVAEVPGVGLEDLEIDLKGRKLTLSTKAGTRRAYKKVVELGSEVDAESLQSTCRNGVLEIRLQKKIAGNGGRQEK